MIHRVAKMQAGQTALVTGANGGVGTALLELLQQIGVKCIASAHSRHFALLESYGAVPIDRDRPLADAVRDKVPGGVDVSFDILGGAGTAACIRATRKRGLVVGYGFMATVKDGKSSTWLVLRTFWSCFVGARLSGRRGAFYGITARYRKDKQPFKEDLAALLQLLRDGRLRPKIAHQLPLLDGRRAQELLEAGGIQGKIVLAR
jgi:NADPH:quinone reductase-like Zn-dependent oxidoreductase